MAGEQSCISASFLIVLLIVLLLIYNYVWPDKTENLVRQPMLITLPEIDKYFEPRERLAQPWSGVGRPNNAGGTAVKVTETQSGGIAGINITTTLNNQGYWSQTTTEGGTNTGQIDPSIAAKLIAAAEAAPRSKSQDNQGNDLIYYTVTLQYPSMEQVSKQVDVSVFPDGTFDPM